jgi:hypothetical protein
LVNSPFLPSLCWSPNLKAPKASLTPTPVGTNIRLNNAALKDTLRSKHIAFSAMPPTFSTQSTKSASPAQLITSTTREPKDVTARSHVPSPDNLMVTTSANAQLIKKATKESSTRPKTPATVPLTYLSGTESTASSAPPEPNTIPRSNNAITAQKASSETLQATLVSLDSDLFINLFVFYTLTLKFVEVLKFQSSCIFLDKQS